MSWWHLHPDVFVWLAVMVGLYFYGLRSVGRPQGLRATRGQIIWFLSGIAMLYAGAGTPIHDIGEQRLFSVHMVQHMLFTLVAPPMLLMGLPGWLLRPLIRPRWSFAVARALTLALPAMALFNAVTLITHLPPVVDLALRQHAVHFLIHVILILTASLMWWPVLSPMAELPRLSPPFQMVYLFVQSLVPTVLASFITFARDVVYPFYAEAPRLWGVSALDDQLVAGLIMKIGGGLILWFVITGVFFTWVSRENRKAEPRPLAWEDVEQELGRMGLTKTASRVEP
ncbi:MAG: cytochrome c oxidase assembly protein [Dehalococcoidia bacterium]